MQTKSSMAWVITIVLILQTCFVQAQNLIPNGDFEQGPDITSGGWCCKVDSNCQATGDYISGPDFWTVISDSPDRLVESNIKYICWDNDSAQSGKSYITIEYGDKVKATLITPLQKNSIYKLSYYAGLETWGITGSCGSVPNRFCFDFLNSNSILSPFIVNKAWQYFDTIFTASDSSSEIEISGSTPVLCGANVDNIRLEKITGLNNYTLNTDIKIYPNPITGKVFFNYLPFDTKKIEISDLIGNKIIQYNKAEFYDNSIDLSFMQNGFYFLLIETKENIYCKSIIISK